MLCTKLICVVTTKMPWNENLGKYRVSSVVSCSVRQLSVEHQLVLTVML